jgi:hypothetical protein
MKMKMKILQKTKQFFVVIPRDVIVVSKFAPIKVATTITAATEN